MRQSQASGLVGKEKKKQKEVEKNTERNFKADSEKKRKESEEG
jgi:hypothetical protein